MLARSARGDGGGNGSGGGGAWRSSGSMERYASVQHELRGMPLSLSVPAVQRYRPWHGYIGSIELQNRQQSVSLELRTVLGFRARHPFGLPELKAGFAAMRRLGLEYYEYFGDGERYGRLYRQFASVLLELGTMWRVREQHAAVLHELTTREDHKLAGET